MENAIILVLLALAVAVGIWYTVRHFKGKGGCCGGGGRFDAGMLYYTPQIWCSDNTDAVDRIRIQYGTSFGYPVSAVGAHVSTVPNHQTGRSVSFKTRGVVAMAGTFGYELDLGKLLPEEKEEVKEQVRAY